MRRSQTVYWALIVSIGIASGCGTTGRPISKSWLRGKDKTSEKQGERLVSGNPFRRVGDIDAKSDAKEKGPVDHDAETRQLIETELADATPEERKNLKADFATLDTLVVKQILKLRRLRIQMEQQQKQQVATRSARSADDNYSGLGASFPGAGQPGNETRYGPDGSRGIRTVAATEDDLGSKRAAGDFGHSIIFADGADIPVITRRIPHPAQSADRHSSRPPFPTPPAASPHAQSADRPIQPAVNEAYAALPDQGTGSIPATEQIHAPLQQGQPVGRPPHAQQPTSTPAVPATTRNPLQFTGIAPSTAQLPGDVGMLNSGGREDPSSIQWRESLQRLIVIAEEQAYAAQSAWEQADQLGPGQNIDEPTRRRLLEARREDFVEKQVDLRMLYLMSGQQARALERVRGLDPADQEFWTQVMWSLANYFDLEGIPNRDDRATQTVTQLRAAIQHLQETAKLEIRNVDFCTKISSFGNYEPFENNVFRSGQPVMVYAEIENFSSDRGSDGVYRTQLKSTVEIHRVTPQGSEVVDTIDFDATTDLCRNHRRDYYHSYELQIPDKATSGSYALVLIVEDQFSKRVATYSRNFTVE